MQPDKNVMSAPKLFALTLPNHIRLPARTECNYRRQPRNREQTPRPANVYLKKNHRRRGFVISGMVSLAIGVVGVHWDSSSMFTNSTLHSDSSTVAAVGAARRRRGVAGGAGCFGGAGGGGVATGRPRPSAASAGVRACCECGGGGGGGGGQVADGRWLPVGSGGCDAMLR